MVTNTTLQEDKSVELFKNSDNIRISDAAKIVPYLTSSGINIESSPEGFTG